MINNLTSNFEKIYSREELNYALLLARSKLLRSVIPYG